MNTKSQLLKTLIREEVRKQLQENLAQSFKKDRPDFLNNLVTGEYDWKPAERVIDKISQDDSIMRTLKQMQGTAQKGQLLIKFAQLLGISKSQLSLWGLTKMLK